MSVHRVLLVEDDPADARLVQELLRRCRSEFEVVQAGRLETALELATTAPVDVILLDLTLPDSSGLDTVRRACAAAPDLPIVVMASVEDEEVALRAVAEGAQDYLVKGEMEPPLLQRSLAYAIERKAFERQLRHHALHDAPTGLPNRRLLLERLDAAALLHERQGRRFAVLSISLDSLRAINTSYGLSLGDRWTSSAVARLVGLLQRGDTLARVGPEHLIALVEVDEPADALRLAARVQHELQRRERVEGEELFTTASIGITTSDTRHARPEQHLRDAVAAMSQARAQGGGRHRIFDAPMHQHMLSRLRLDAELRQALERDELEPWYQPLVWLHSGEIAGFEALVRWRHPERGIVAPGEFIGVAEDAGLMPALFERLLPKVLEQARTWQHGRPSLMMNINLSPRQIGEPELLELFARQLARFSPTPYSLGIEITESLLVEDDTATAAVLHGIKDMKVRVLLDDFGVGYSALSCLHRFPIDGIKVDRSFLARVGTREDGGAEIVRAVVNLAEGLGKSTTAEGIETPAQLRFVRALGCELGQGFWFGRPVPADEATALLLRGRMEGGSPPFPPGPRAVHSHARGRVLLVDAGPGRLRQELETQGYEVLVTPGGPELGEVAAREQPEVVLLSDEAGPDAAEACRGLRDAAETGTIPVVLLSAWPEDDPRTLAALAAGGRDVISPGAPASVLCARLDSQIAIARAQARLRRSAMTDELTGVFSRRFLFGALRRTVKSLSRRGPGGIAILLADVDHFRRVNETEGQKAGDRLLAHIARTIDASSRDTDLVARFGGEEFVVVLPDVDAAGARHVAERIRSDVERSCRSTVSIGGAFLDHVPVALMRDGNELDRTIETMIREADEAVADAKRAGRNCVMFKHRRLAPDAGA
jgi:diguanylate cyclase (GGDEF)-like protein